MPAPGACGANHGLADESTTGKLSRSTGSPAGSGPSRTCWTPASTPLATTCTRTTTRRTGSDLEPAQEEEGYQLRALLPRPGGGRVAGLDRGRSPPQVVGPGEDHRRRVRGGPADRGTHLRRHREIGRAPWRERVCKYESIAVVAVSLKKKNRDS